MLVFLITVELIL